MRRRGVGFIGVGAAADRHRRALDGSRAGWPVAAWGLARSDRERARAWSVRLHRGLRGLVEDPEVEAVFVPSPSETCRELTLLTLEAREPVLVGKPVAASAVGVLERGRRLIAAGGLGRVYVTWIVHAVSVIRPSGELAARYPGVLQQVMPHHLLGRPRRVVALRPRSPGQGLDREGQVALQLETADGGLARLFASFATDDETNQPWTFMGKTSGDTGGFVRTCRDVIVARSIGIHARGYVPHEEGVQSQDEHFLTRCLEGGAPLSSLRDAYLVQVIVEAASRSIVSGRAVEPAFEDVGVPP